MKTAAQVIQEQQWKALAGCVETLAGKEIVIVVKDREKNGKLASVETDALTYAVAALPELFAACVAMTEGRKGAKMMARAAVEKATAWDRI